MHTSSKHRSRGATLGLILLAVTGGALDAAAQTEVERRVPARSDGTVSIENVAGSVTVTGWDRDEVEVTGTLDRDVEELEIETSGGKVEIRVELPRRNRGKKGAAHLEVRVPSRSNLDVEVVSAEVRIEGIEGKVDVEAVSGATQVAGAPRSVDVETVSGSVTVQAAGAPVSVESVSGAIDVTGAARRLDVETVSGEVTLTADDLEEADVESVSGSVSLSTHLAAGAKVELSNHSGGIDLRLDPSTSARFEVTTFSGRIDNQLGPPARRASRYTPGYELDFSLGGGGAEVIVESFSGNVTLRAR